MLIHLRYCGVDYDVEAANNPAAHFARNGVSLNSITAAFVSLAGPGIEQKQNLVSNNSPSSAFYSKNAYQVNLAPGNYQVRFVTGIARGTIGNPNFVDYDDVVVVG